MQIGDEASSSVILAGRALFEKMLTTHARHRIFCSNLFTYVFYQCPATGLTGRALLVQMLLTLETPGNLVQILYNFVF